MSYKCVIWGAGQVFGNNIGHIRKYALKNDIEIIGIIADQDIGHEISGIQHINKTQILKHDFDFIIIMVGDRLLPQIMEEAVLLGIDKEKLLGYRAFVDSDLEIDKYLELKKDCPTILSNNCWGGVTYHHLALEFTSPFINMWVSDEDYLKLLADPHRYMEASLSFERKDVDPNSKKVYPIGRCDDILLHFNHYGSFEEANDCWIKRKRKMNLNNLFVMMYTDDEQIANKFAKLPYEKKVCFVPFKTEAESLCYVQLLEQPEFNKVPFWEIVLGIAKREYPYYDEYRLLMQGRIELLAQR